MQEPELHDDEEQEDDVREARAEEVLPDVPEAYVAQGNQVIGGGEGQ
jgi:hypothetical protein